MVCRSGAEESRVSDEGLTETDEGPTVGQMNRGRVGQYDAFPEIISQQCVCVRGACALHCTSNNSSNEESHRWLPTLIIHYHH